MSTVPVLSNTTYEPWAVLMIICLLLCSAEAKQTLWDSERILSAAFYRLEDDSFLSLVSQGFSGVGSTDTESAGPVLPIQTRLPDRGRDSQPRPLSDNTQLDLLKAKTAKPSEPSSDLSQSPKPSEASASKAFSPRPEPLRSELPKPAESPKPASSPEKSPNEGAVKGPTPLKGVSQGKDPRLQCVKLSKSITNIALQVSRIRNDQKRSETIRNGQKRSETIRNDQKRSETVRNDQKRSETIRNDQRQ